MDDWIFTLALFLCLWIFFTARLLRYFHERDKRTNR